MCVCVGVHVCECIYTSIYIYIYICLYIQLEGTRRKGRPMKGWREKVVRDLQVLGVRRWRELVIDSEKWRGIVRQAKAHSGL